jgi:hypothetical protein
MTYGIHLIIFMIIMRNNTRMEMIMIMLAMIMKMIYTMVW